MDARFFRSREFIASAIVAGLVLAGGAAALTLPGITGGAFQRNEVCREPTLQGAALPAVEPTDATHASGRTVTRTLDYAFDAARFDTARVVACLGVGHFTMAPSDDDEAHLTVAIESRGTNAERIVGATDVQTRLLDDGGTLVLATWQASSGRASTWFGGEGSHVRVQLRLPAMLLVDLHASVDVGSVHAIDHRLGDVDARSDVGDVTLENVDLTGNLTAATDVGDVRVRLASLQAGTLRVMADVGDVTLTMPTRADVGFDVTAATDVGDVTVDIGPTDIMQGQADGPSESMRARSRDYESKPTHVIVHANADVGDVTVTAA